MSIVKVNCDNLEDNPKCAHGPTLRFTRLIKGKEQNFYGCSACRDRKDCPFFLLLGDKITPSKQLSWDEWKKNVFPQIDYNRVFSKFKSFQKLSPKSRSFCRTCSCFVFPLEVIEHTGHDIKNNVTNSELKYPSNLFLPIQNDKKEAQYWFSDKSIDFIFINLCKMKIQSIINLGTPTIHAKLRQKKFNSLLLDIDHRYHNFYNSREFCWFNMLNFHFMDNEEIGKEAVKKILNQPPVALILDPPFGARIELMARTIQKFQSQSEENLKILLILPYFLEHQVIKYLPNLKMLDFQIDYVNHKKFKNKTSNKKSPIRVFTNIDPRNFTFSEDDGYTFCEKCQAWRSKNNKHCNLCKTCPAKNGGIYKHCLICKICVKVSWAHCNNCKRCILIGHICCQSVVNSEDVKIKKIKTS